jgi:hypothetical protein
MLSKHFVEAYAAAVDQIPTGDQAPSCEEMIAFIQEMLDTESHDDEGGQQLLAFRDFEAFFEAMDTATAYEQMDAGDSITEYKPLLQIAFDALVAQYREEGSACVQDAAPSY